MSRKRILIGAAVAAVVLGGAGAGVAVATGGGGDDSEPPISGPALEQASAAALAHTGGGRVTETEVGDEESFYEVEVTLDGGEQLDVQLDRDFTVLSADRDVDEPGDDEDDDE